MHAKLRLDSQPCPSPQRVPSACVTSLPLTHRSTLARKGYKVLLLEAGKNTTNNTVYSIPLRHGEAVEDPMAGLSYYVRLTENRTSVYYPRAQGLGGCTLMHALITSPLPSSIDFEPIRSETGDDSWSVDRMHEIWRDMINV